MLLKQREKSVTCLQPHQKQALWREAARFKPAWQLSIVPKRYSWKAKTSCKKGMIIKQDLVDRWHFIQRPTQEGLAPVELMKSQIAENRRPCALPLVLVEKKDGRLGIHVAFASSTLKQQRKCIQDRAKWFCCIDVQSCYLQVWVWDFKKNKDCNDHTLRSLWI